MAKAKKHKVPAETIKPSAQASSFRAHPASPIKAPAANQPSIKALAAGQPLSVKAPAAAQPTAIPGSIKETSMLTDITKVGYMDFHAFISDIEASPSFHPNPGHVGDTSGPRSAVALPGKETFSEAPV
ncbi:hypothetical protein Salat_1129000 [Sesamum alatum]|uniref:Uncharacterized protein n=1 Tax=Sesamum alatum TaxID=300844 RepID=A0AAE1YDW8_9LAMI|nr:hypothetical protein Salat_1129000 [Sesamum alatum]